MTNKKSPAVIITDVDYEIALNRVAELSAMNKRLETSSLDRLARAESAEARVRELEAANAELQRQLEQAQRRDAFLERLALHNLDNEAQS